jgi:hypothetical protein
MQILNIKNFWLLLGMLSFNESVFAMDIEKENIEETNKTVLQVPSEKNEEREQSNLLLTKIKNLPKESLEKQTDMKNSIAYNAYRHDRYWVNKDGRHVLLENK